MKAIINNDTKKEIITDVTKLQERCDEIDTIKESKLVQEIVLALKNTLRAIPTGTGLAANQIGYDKRVFVINFNGDIRTFINPVIAHAKGLSLNKESCLSIPGKNFIVPRNTEIEIIYQTPLGKTESRKLIGLAACVFQHELAHLDGITLEDIGLELTEEFEKASEEEQQEVLAAYMDSLEIKHKELEKVIDEDEELKKASDGIKFIEALQRGDVQIENNKK